MVNWNTFLMAVSLALADSETPQDETIQCICTTRICQEMAEPVCITSGLCYSQYLDRKDGSNPVTKGCVNLKTPLLCENRPPKSTSLRVRWPILLCCRTNMCNKEDLQLHQMTQADRLDLGNSIGPTSRVEIEGDEMSESMGNSSRSPNRTTNRNNQAVLMLNSNNTLSNPTVLIVFCVGLVVLLAIGITGCCVLQRQQVY